MRKANHMLVRADVRRGLPIADKSVQCVVTSPPYWNLRDYQDDRQMGSEETPELYVAGMVALFADVWRILRDDGVVWLNLGDTYCNTDKWGGGGGNVGKQTLAADGSVPSWDAVRRKKPHIDGIKPKDLVGIPWMVAFALRSAGWYLRSDCIWFKRNPMPESTEDRPGKAHEYVFLLTKSDRYFYDHVAVQETAVGGTPGNKTHKGKTAYEGGDERHRTKAGLCNMGASETRNLRTVWDIEEDEWAQFLRWKADQEAAVPDVWDIPLTPFKGAHFATMPRALARRCLMAGTSAKGCCPECRTPWERVIEKDREPTRPGANTKVAEARNKLPAEEPGRSRGAARFEKSTLGSIAGNRDPQRHTTTTRTVGWEPGCRCDTGEPVPCRVLDPFNGAATTGVEADSLGLDYVGTDCNADYLAMSARRIARPHAPMPRASAVESLPLFA